MKRKLIPTAILLLVILCFAAAIPANAAETDSSVLMGDATADGFVSTYDARLIMRAAVGAAVIKEENLPYADLDGDGVITTADSRKTLRIAVNLDTTESHSYTLTESKAPLCSENGYARYTCSDCGDIKTIILTSDEHDYALTSKKAATCTEQGERIYTCTRCKKSYTKHTPLVSHKYSKPKIDAPSKCKVCGKPNEDAKMTEQEIVKDISSRVSRDEITKNMNAISGNIGSRWYSGNNIDRAYNKIISILKSYGFSSSDIVTDYFYVNGYSQKNIYCTIPAKKSGADVMLFCAHYDSANIGRGAVDNASGVCAVLETARVLKSLNMNFDKEIRICFFSGEEVGYHGAYRYCSYYYYSLPRHVFTLNVDMAGHPKSSKNWYLCVSTEPYVPSAYSYRTAYSNNTSRNLDKSKALIGSCGEAGYKSPVTAGMHDLLPFRRYGVNAATLSWREIDYSRGYGNDYSLASPSIIHTSSDTVSNISLYSIYKATQVMTGAAGEVLFVK